MADERKRGFLTNDEIVRRLMTDPFTSESDLEQAMDRFQELQRMFVCQALIRRLPDVSRAIELWPDVEKDPETGVYVYNDLDNRVTADFSEDGKRALIAHESVAVIADNARFFALCLEANRDIRQGGVAVGDLDAMAMYRVYNKFEDAIEEMKEFASDWTDMTGAIRHLSTLETAKERADRFPSAPSLDDFRAALRSPDGLPKRHLHTCLVRMDLKHVRDYLDMVFGVDSRAARSLPSGEMDDLREEERMRRLAEPRGSSLNATPPQIDLALSHLGHMREFMECDLGLDAERKDELAP